MSTQEKDAQFVETIAKMLVEHPADVQVNRTIDDLGVLITLRVNAADMATIIGRDGRSAKSIRTLLRIIGAKNDERVNLKIVEPEGAESPTRTEKSMPEESMEVPAAAPEASVAPAADPTDTDSILNDVPEPLA